VTHHAGFLFSDTRIGGMRYDKQAGACLQNEVRAIPSMGSWLSSDGLCGVKETTTEAKLGG